MRILIDYRPALRERSGVGEYVHQLARALARDGPADEIVAFTSSWSDRPSADSQAELLPARIVDLRLPVRALNLAWHRLGWPPIERLTRSIFDVVHSPHPLLLPSRNAAQVVTVHDLDFLSHRDRVHAEIRRDYRALVAGHARRADRVVVPSRYTAGLVERLLGVPRDLVSVCPEGVPDWPSASREVRSGRRPGYLLFIGTLEARKNIPGLLAAYRALVAQLPDAPSLVLAGKAPPEATPWLRDMREPPFAGRVEHLGYVEPAERRDVYGGAACLILPSFDEGFGLPVVEAMSLGVPVIAANRGALPEVLGDAGILIEPDDPAGIAAAMARVLGDADVAADLAARGRNRARQYTWQRCAALTREAYALAIDARRQRTRRGNPRPPGAGP